MRKEIIITRPPPLNEKSAGVWRENGFEVYLIPFFELQWLYTGINFSDLYHEDQFIPYIIVTSELAILALSCMTAHRGFTLISVGLSSKLYAQSLGFHKVYTAPQQGVAALCKYISQYIKKDQPLLYLRGEKVSYDLVSDLSEKGYKVKDFMVYSLSPSLLFLENITPVLTNLNDKNHVGITCYSPRILEGIERIFHEKHPSFFEKCILLTLGIPHGKPCPEWGKVIYASTNSECIDTINKIEYL